MTRSLIALWLTLIAAIITIAVLAQFWLSQRQTSAQQRVSEILAGSLVAFDDAIERLIAGYAVDMQRQSEACDLLDPASCVQLTRSPLVSTLVVVDSDSRLVFPTDFSNASADRQSLIDEAQQLLERNGRSTACSSSNFFHRKFRQAARFTAICRPGLEKSQFAELYQSTTRASSSKPKPLLPAPHNRPLLDELLRSPPLKLLRSHLTAIARRRSRQSSVG